MNLSIYGAQQTGKHYQVNDGKWRHLAVSVVPLGADSISVKLFLDGRQETQFLNKIRTSGIEFNTQPSDLTVGGYSFRGWIDDLRIYAANLKEGEIAMIIAEKENGDLVISNQNYTLSAWIKPANLPRDNQFKFANGRFFQRDWVEICVLIPGI